MAELVSMCLVEVANEVGKLAALTDLLKQAGINIRAVCAWTEGDAGKMLLLTDDNETACATISGSVTSCGVQEGVAVEVPNEVGALNAVAAKIAQAGINIQFACATVSGGSTLVVIGTDNNAEAAKAC